MDTSMSGPQSAGTVSFNRFGSCGSRIAMQPDTSLPLQLTASLPTTPLRAIAEPSFTEIDMSVRNLSATAVQVMTMRRGARLALTKEGVVVAGAGGMRPAGTQYAIEPGEAHDYKSILNLVNCDTNSGLAPGDYQVHALQRFRFVDEGLNIGSEILVYGGPWDVEVG